MILQEFSATSLKTRDRIELRFGDGTGNGPGSESDSMKIREDILGPGTLQFCSVSVRPAALREAFGGGVSSARGGVPRDAPAERQRVR